MIRFLDLNGEPIDPMPRLSVGVSDSSGPEHALRHFAPAPNNEIVRRVLGRTEVMVERETFVFVVQDGKTYERDVCVGPNRVIGEYVENPVNGHYYLAIEGGSDFSFAQAKEFAASVRYRGIQGHLVTITSKEEDTFLFEKFQSRGYSWAGATDKETEGEWKWICGPEKGETFFSTKTNIGAYHNWTNRPANWTSQSDSRARSSPAPYLIEPNNRSEEEHFLMWNWGPKGSWNDWDMHRTSGYVIIEFSEESEN